MSIAAALQALEAMRCVGIGAVHHYGIGAQVPDSIVQPSLFLALGSTEDWTYQTESYDALAATLNVGVALTVIVERYKGRGRPESMQQLPDWLQRVMTMLAGDITLGSYLAAPMMGNVRKAGILNSGQARYIGLIMDLRLLVRIQAP